jgi:outer membrane protein insertion porin family
MHHRFRRMPIALLIAVLLIVEICPAGLIAQTSKVVDIVITGNQNVNKETIAGVINIKPGTEYSEEAVEKDKASIMGLGYFSAVSARTENTSGGVKLIFDVVENAVVKDIKIVGNGPIPVEKVMSVIRTKPGRVLNMATMNLDAEAIQQLYRDEGYFGTFITEDISIDRDTGVLTIPIVVPVVESIDIVGNKKTQEHVFIREMKTKPGQYFNTKVLKEDYSRIFDLGILEDIQAPQSETGSEIGKVRVVIPVTEKKTGQVSVSLGYNARQKMVGRAEVTETNFRGKGQQLNLMWETGITGNTQGGSSYEIGFGEPWLDSKRTSLSVDLYNKVLYRFANGFLGQGSEFDGQTYFERHKGGQLTVGRPFTEKSKGFITIKAENVQPSDPVALLNADNTAKDTLSEGNVASATLKWINNTRDQTIDPVSGSYNEVSLELGTVDGNTFDPVFGDQKKVNDVPVTDKNGQPVYEVDAVNKIPQNGPFTKVMFDTRRYFSKGGPRESVKERRKVIAARLQAGIASGTIPFYEQFFIGGSDTLRGYREDRFWGDKMFLASVEYRVPVAKALTGVAFVDYGDAWGTGQEVAGLTQTTGFSGQIGTGLGIRVETPIGNLRLDYGFGSEGSRTHFSIGQAF